MNTQKSSPLEKIKLFCSQIGENQLIVQGAGGNVSWKNENTLWVKASGTWLADAKIKNIFIPVKLNHLKQSIHKKKFSANPIVMGESKLKPSIETMLHAVIPQRVVLHLHAVDPLALLVRKNAKEELQKKIKNLFKYALVDYFKPGAELAEAVEQEIVEKNNLKIFFLKNHGIIIADDNINAVASKLNQLLSLLKINTPITNTHNYSKYTGQRYQIKNYSPSKKEWANELAVKKEFSSRLISDWALYPDHVVFLGKKAAIIDNNYNSQDLNKNKSVEPPFIFDVGRGTLENTKVTEAQKKQLRCYYNVLARQSTEQKLQSISEEQVNELLNWEAEKYRTSIDA